MEKRQIDKTLQKRHNNDIDIEKIFTFSKS